MKSHYFQGLEIHPRWFFGISAINSSKAIDALRFQDEDEDEDEDEDDDDDDDDEVPVQPKFKRCQKLESHLGLILQHTPLQLMAEHQGIYQPLIFGRWTGVNLTLTQQQRR